MARIRPFRAWRYNEETIPDVNRMFSPLFDVVSKEQLEALRKITYNSVHLSVPVGIPQTAARLQEWKDQDILHQDPLPGIYIYYQRFSLFGDAKKYVRKGFVCLINIDETSGSQGSDVVLHEDTIASSVEDRTRLLEQTLLNVAPTHGLYDDPDFSLEALMDGYMQHPDYEYMDYQGVINQLVVVQNRADIQKFLDLIGPKKVYLADGHHRLASSVSLLQEAEKVQGKLPEDHIFRYHLMYLTNLRADDLRILPIHRVFNMKGFYGRPQDLLRRFEPYFSWVDVTMNKTPLIQELHGKKRTFAMVAGERQYLFTLRPEIDPVVAIGLDIPSSVKELDYTVLQYFVFDRIFGIPYGEMKRNTQVEYVKDFGTAVKTALTDSSKVAFIMNELKMDQMLAVCESGAIMPMKSTYFYPKVVCGLVFASIDPNENNGPFDSGFGLAQA